MLPLEKLVFLSQNQIQIHSLNLSLPIWDFGEQLGERIEVCLLSSLEAFLQLFLAVSQPVFLLIFEELFLEVSLFQKQILK